MNDRWIIDGTPSKRFPVYSRANTGEVLPDPASPLGWTLVWLPGVVEGWADGHVSLGTFERWEFGDPPEACDVFGGFLYINVSVARVYGERTPGASAKLIDDTFFGDHPDVPMYAAHPDDASPAARERMTSTLEWVLHAPGLPELLEDRAEVDAVVATRPDFATLSDADLVARARGLVPLVRRLFDRHFLVSASAAFGPGVVGGVLAELGEPDAMLVLLGAIGDVDSAAPCLAMWDLSRQVRGSAALTRAFDGGRPGLVERLDGVPGDEATAFRAALESLLVRFGSRGPNEWDIHAPTWGTRPAIALVAIDRMRLQDDAHSPHRRAEELVVEQAATLARLLGRCTEEQAEQLQTGIRSGQVFLAGRERTKTTIILAIHEVRLAMLELARRMVARGAIADEDELFMLLDGELDDFLVDPVRFRGALAGRRAEHAALAELRPPWVVDGTAPPLSTWRRRADDDVAPVQPGDVLRGGASSPGRATGRARVVHHPADADRLEPGDILVAPVTDPSWTPLFVTAAGVVVDVGAMGSHAMIVSRELGIPCVASVQDGTRRIPDGAIISVDGTHGTVHIEALDARPQPAVRG